ncbi:hypothetical protein T265_12372 [Opisthorchis viverrini]|uniref:TLC domain-containing protein n=1 Tax=Opisthorchis viverrini TaxID=6198 RepID=A0A074YTJ1_OPIVI|nr:hypothetical protein T265_12372 [Opisthorchis viverrini]KER18111.1 hypothetical protein T265_12372 [Opisthorchis viverrini]
MKLIGFFQTSNSSGLFFLQSPSDNLYIDPPPFDLQFIYCVQMTHYLHSAYATLYLDPWRSDSPAMLLHHVVTLSLISLSFVRR